MELRLSDFKVGDRVQAHPATDRWMRGDRYGTVEKIGRTRLHIHWDKSGKRQALFPGSIGEIVR